MRVLHIALTDGGGAGMGMMNQHRALRDMGIDSRVLVAIKRGNDSTATEMRPNLNIWSSNRYVQTLQRAACRFGFSLNPYDRYHHLIYNVRRRHPAEFDNPCSQYDVLSHPLVGWADVVNLHYISGFIDFPTFFTGINKPVVWTMRDENAGLGGFHYVEARRQLYNFYAQLEDSFLAIKRKAINSCKHLHIVSLSHVMQQFCKEVDFLATRPNSIIPNAICPDDYPRYERMKTRQKLGLATNDIVVAFVCCALGEERKGFFVALDAIRRLNREQSQLLHSKTIRLLCVGKDNIGINDKDVITLGIVADKQRLAMIYSAADLFLNVSSQESFGKTIVESLYMGTPVVSTSVGIAPEIITPHNGCLCTERTPQTIAKAIKVALSTSYNHATIRKEATALFSPQRVAEQYASLYSNVIRNS